MFPTAQCHRNIKKGNKQFLQGGDTNHCYLPRSRMNALNSNCRKTSPAQQLRLQRDRSKSSSASQNLALQKSDSLGSGHHDRSEGGSRMWYHSQSPVGLQWRRGDGGKTRRQPWAVVLQLLDGAIQLLKMTGGVGGVNLSLSRSHIASVIFRPGQFGKICLDKTINKNMFVTRSDAAFFLMGERLRVLLRRDTSEENCTHLMGRKIKDHTVAQMEPISAEVRVLRSWALFRQRRRATHHF